MSKIETESKCVKEGCRGRKEWRWRREGAERAEADSYSCLVTLKADSAKNRVSRSEGQRSCKRYGGREKGGREENRAECAESDSPSCNLTVMADTTRYSCEYRSQKETTWRAHLWRVQVGGFCVNICVCARTCGCVKAK